MLIIGNTLDGHCDALAAELNRRNREFFRLNLDELRTGEIAISFEGPYGASIFIEHLSTGRVINLDECGAIFFRRGDLSVWAYSEQLEGNEAEIDNFIRSEINECLWHIIYLYRERCLTLPHKAYTATRLFQLGQAVKHGFKVPRYLITNSIRKTKQFFDEVGDVVIKPLQNIDQAVFSDMNSTYTESISYKDISRDVLERCPVLFMERINKVADIRVAVVGNNLFATRITQNEKSGIYIDFRQAKQEELHYDPVNIQANKGEHIVKFCHSFGQRYGHLDFGMLANGEMVFFENNLNGQWLWIEDATKVGVTSAIVDELERMSRRFIGLPQEC